LPAVQSRLSSRMLPCLAPRFTPPLYVELTARA
jgi:hypothetical protein